ncbi:hypothetical protein ZTR_06062 [Talaromyces verruculosus]|nr:hypothetical protein ZTR_06062 [Talaromyces verruculosus]
MDRLRSLISPFKEKDVVYSEINPGSEELLAKTGRNGSFSMRGALIWKPSRLQWGLSIAALFIVLIFGFVIVAARNSSSVPVFSAELIPEGTPVIRTFEDTFAFGGPRTNRTDAAWDSLIPTGGGFIPVLNPEAYGLPNDDRQGTQLWGVSVFHQLHCLTHPK